MWRRRLTNGEVRNCAKLRRGKKAKFRARPRAGQNALIGLRVVGWPEEAEGYC